MTALLDESNRRPVQMFRHLLAQRNLAVLICVAALLLKVLVPAGYMIGNDHDRITMTICSGVTPSTITLDVPSDHGTDQYGGKDHGSKDHAKAEMPCAFSGHSAAALGATDPIQLAALIAFILAVGLAPVLLPRLAQPAYLRPPLRGPPAYL